MLDQLPKVVLHDHLDGSMRINTLIELAEESGVRLPERDPVSLAAWFDQSGSGSLEQYLTAFAQTVAVLQTSTALERVAYEVALDHADDGVVYLEIRYALELTHLPLEESLKAMLKGAARAEAEREIAVRVIVDAMRQNNRSLEVARTAASCGAAGFDLAGPEHGFPASRHADACQYAALRGIGLTIHAGEGDGPSSIADALACGATRIGHGIRIIEDCTVVDGTIVDMGSVATEVYERGIPLEICISSNMQTMAISDPSLHPVGTLARAGFAVTLNTDNRLMSNTTMAREFALARDYHGFTEVDFARATRTALRAAFIDAETKKEIWANSIAPRYAAFGVMLDY